MNFEKLVTDTFRNILQRLHNVETQERAEQAGAVQSVAFASLPAAGQRGRLRFCSNCRKVGEGAGLGTGTPVYDDATAWRRTGDDSTAAV